MIWLYEYVYSFYFRVEIFKDIDIFIRFLIRWVLDVCIEENLKVW